MYVTDITKITMRTAPNSDNKIIQMLESGSVVNILERSGAWSKVRSKNGKEGWALTRFLVNKKPAVTLFYVKLFVLKRLKILWLWGIMCVFYG